MMSDAEIGPADGSDEGRNETSADPGADAAHVDDYVRRLRPDPEASAQRVVVLSGLLGDSDRSGWRRLYLSRELTRYAEFRDEDLVYREAVPAEQAPMRGLESSRVGVKRGARIDFIVSREGQPLDEFDLDLRMGRRRRSPPTVAAPLLPPQTLEEACPGDSLFEICDTAFVCPDTVQCQFATVQPTLCGDDTCNTCPTICDNTCNTCPTDCNAGTCFPTQCGGTCLLCTQGQATCLPTQCQGTCQTQCQNTCQYTRCQDTCQGTCQDTCATCHTQCQQHTCAATCGCPTNNPHVNTCGPNPLCRVP